MFADCFYKAFRDAFFASLMRAYSKRDEIYFCESLENEIYLKDRIYHMP